MEELAEIVIDLFRDENFTDFGRSLLEKQYCLPGERIQEALARASEAFCGGDLELAQRLYDYSSNLWFSFATPLLANGGTNRGLPISCFLNYVEDSIGGLAANFTENVFLSVNGGGIGTYWGDIRSVGEKSSKGAETPGVMPFLHVQDAQVLAYHQGATRRGAAAAYMDVSHPEIFEFIAMRSSTGGDVHRKNENLHHGVCLPDSFMRAVASNGSWHLKDPHSGRVTQSVKARELWIKILQQRVKLGEPYLFFVDTANRALPKSLAAKGLKIHHSNLCTEIVLPTNKDRTAVCCLSSINVAKYDEWFPHREQFITDLVTMLDNVLDVFCQEAPPNLWRAVNSARAERSLGLGTLGFHTWLQLNRIPMNSPEAKEFNKEFYSELHSLAKKASAKLAQERGEPEDMVGTGYRNAHVLAIAPNANSSIICGGVSPSIEPLSANAFTQKTRIGSREVRNIALWAVLDEIGKGTEDVWKSISLNKGSVQHLDFLSPELKQVFLTASETDPDLLIELAADRQPYICQAQSLNLFMPSNVSARLLHKVHFGAWEKGLKALYYLRSTSVRHTGIGILEEQPPTCNLESGCKACEG